MMDDATPRRSRRRIVPPRTRPAALASHDGRAIRRRRRLATLGLVGAALLALALIALAAGGGPQTDTTPPAPAPATTTTQPDEAAPGTSGDGAGRGRAAARTGAAEASELQGKPG
jgi:hypothetical protein